MTGINASSETLIEITAVVRDRYGNIKDTETERLSLSEALLGKELWNQVQEIRKQTEMQNGNIH